MKRSADRGASLVEFALILPVFALLLFGMISAGLALNDKQQMTHATREGARYAATVPANQTFTNGQPWAQNVRDLIVERSTGSLTSANVCVSLVQGSPGVVVNNDAQFTTRSPVAPCIPNQAYPVSVNDNGRRVQVTATKPAKIELIVFGTLGITIDVDATAKSESNS